MKTKRTKLSAIIAMILAVVMIAGCGSSAAAPAAAASSAKSEAPAAAASSAKSEAPAAAASSAKSEAPAAEASSAKSEAPAAASAEAVTLKMGALSQDPINATKKLTSIQEEAKYIVERTAELSGGSLTIDGYWGATLGNNPSMQEQVMMGELDMHFGQPMSSNDKRYGTWNIPFIFDDYDQIVAAVNPVDGPVFELSSKWFEENGVHLLLISQAMMRAFISAKHEVVLPKDCADLKIRTYEDEVVNTFWGSLGTASIIPGSEIYSALQTKTVDAMEFQLTGIEEYNLHEVAHYVTDLNWQWTNGACWTISQSSWDALSPEQQAVLEQVAAEAFDLQASLEQEAIKTVKERLVNDLGMELREVTDEEHQAWVDHARSLDDTFAEMVGRDAYDEYMAAVAEAKDRVKNGTAYTIG